MNSSFDNGYQIAWDATSLKSADKCLRYYKFVHLEGWKRPSVHLLFGGWFATACEHYHKRRFAGESHNDALSAVTFDALCATWIDGAPWESDHNLKNRWNLIRTIVWYLEEYKDDECEIIALKDGTPAAELSFRLEVDRNFIFCGHLDQVVTFMGDPYVKDQKTSGSTVSSLFFKQFDIDHQMSMYSFVGKAAFAIPVKGVMIDAAQIAVGFSRFTRGFTFRNDALLEEWYQDAHRLIDDVHRATDQNHFPARPASCNNYGGCEFRDVCSRAPTFRRQFLEGAGFTKQETWDPLKPR